MKVVRSLGTRKINGKLRSFSIFFCEYCEQEVERINQAKKQISCGCFGRELHKIKMTKHGEGHSNKTKLYRVWSSIRERCARKTHRAYKDYGGRGITVCPEWDDYLVFKKFALENGYAEGLEIDRIDNDGDYCPSNVRFTTAKENTRNRRTTKLSMQKANAIREEYARGNISQKKLGEKYGVTQGLVGFILRKERWA